MADAEAGEAREEVGFREHIDNPIVFVLLLTLAVLALSAAGRSLFARAGWPGLVAFCGG